MFVVHCSLTPAIETYLDSEADAMTLRVHAATVGDTGPFLRERMGIVHAQRRARTFGFVTPYHRFPDPL